MVQTCGIPERFKIVRLEPTNAILESSFTHSLRHPRVGGDLGELRIYAVAEDYS